MKFAAAVEKMTPAKAVPAAAGFVIKTLGNLYNLAIRNHNLQVDILASVQPDIVTGEVPSFIPDLPDAAHFASRGTKPSKK